MISSHLPTLSGQRSLAMISLAVCSPNRGHAREGMERGQGVFCTPSPEVDYPNAFYQALAVWVAVGDGGVQELGILNMAQKPFLITKPL